MFNTNIYAVYTSSYPEPTSLVKYGSVGSNVKWVQDLLKQNGYSLQIDGEFGNITRNAVIHFQKYNNLSTDGIVGQQTRNALKKSVNYSSSTNTGTQISNKYMYTTASVNFRAGPGTNYASKSILPQNTKVYVYQTRTNGWSYIKYNNMLGYISSKYLSNTQSTNTTTATSTLPNFIRNSNNLLTIIKNCKSYYANNNFYYSLANGVRSIPADQSKTYSGKRYVDCSSFVTWALYEYAKANNLTDMMKYFSYQRNSATFASIGANGGNSYLTTVSSLSNARAGDILVTEGHVEFLASHTKNSNGSYTIKVYNCGSNASISVPGITTSDTKYESKIKYILRIK
jgi:peptidoglycan hydrolase-like protein with peptidoglycan-binding domain